MAQRAVTEYGGLDTWVHAAGVLLVAPFDETTPEEFQRVIDVNLMGQVHGAMAAPPHLKGKSGALIHISSIGAKRGAPLQTAYSPSKHGIDGFAETLRMEVQRADLPISVGRRGAGSAADPPGRGGRASTPRTGGPASAAPCRTRR